MKTASKIYNIVLECSTSTIVNDTYHLAFVEGTQETNRFLKSMGLGFNSYQSVYDYWKSGKAIKIESGTSIKYIDLVMSVDELKGLVYWANTKKDDTDKYFNQSPIKSECIKNGSLKYKGVFITLK